LIILNTVLKTEGFYTGEPQEGAANSSQGKPHAAYLMTVRGRDSVDSFVVHMDDKSNFFFDLGKSNSKTNPVFFWCFRNNMLQTAVAAPTQEEFKNIFCCA
jgi:hypothetical protein